MRILAGEPERPPSPAEGASPAALRARLRDVFEVERHPLRLVDAAAEEAGGLIEERLTFATAGGEAVRGLVLRPAGEGPRPGILYIHAHGGRYDIGLDEMTDGRDALVSPLAPALARAGYVVFGIEMPAFGTRSTPGESARAKALLWRGRSLAAQMVGEQAAAFAWLAARPEVDAARIGAVGISMGATLAYWLAAVEERVAAVAHLCCLADVAALIDAGAHDRHGIYLVVPGLLDVAANGAIAGLVAPRAQFCAVGERDPLTPPAALDPALAALSAAYAAAAARENLVVVREADGGHAETQAMRAKMLASLAAHLHPAGAGAARAEAHPTG